MQCNDKKKQWSKESNIGLLVFYGGLMNALPCCFISMTKSRFTSFDVVIVYYASDEAGHDKYLQKK